MSSCFCQPSCASQCGAQWGGNLGESHRTRTSQGTFPNVAPATAPMRNITGALSPDEFDLLCTHLKALSPSTMTPFQADPLAFAAFRMASSGERARLVDLLAERCPRAIPPAPIEFTLAAEEWRGKLTNGFAVPVDACRAARNDEARATLLDAMSAAMPSLRAKIPDNVSFISAVEAWHSVHKGQLPPLRARYVFAWQDHRFAHGAEELFETHESRVLALPGIRRGFPPGNPIPSLRRIVGR